MGNVIACIIEEEIIYQLLMVIALVVSLVGVLIYLLHSNKHQMKILSEQQKLLRTSEARYKLISQKSNDMIFEYDLRGEYMVHSENLDDMAYPELRGGFVDGILESDIIYPADVQLLQDVLIKVTQEQCYTETTLRIKTGSGSYRWHQISFVCVMDDKNTPWRVVGRARDVDKQKREEERLLEKTMHDPLTKMLNKIATRKEIDKTMSQGGDLVHAFLIIDVDYFKQINDTRGHSTGDSVLTCAANGLRGLFRSSDVLGRIGGDEMVVFCRDVKCAEHAEQRAEKVCEMFRTLCDQDAKSLRTSCSVGIAIAPQDGSNFNQLYVNADLALYSAKAAGRNRYERYNPSMVLEEVMLSDL